MGGAARACLQTLKRPAGLGAAATAPGRQGLPRKRGWGAAAPAATAAARALVRVPGAAVVIRRRHSVIVSSHHPYPPLSSPATCEGTLEGPLEVVAASSSLQNFSKFPFEFTCHVLHPKSTALPCSPRHSRPRLVPASSSPRRRLRAAVPTSVVIASTWPPSSPCPRRRRAVVPAPSSPRRRLRVAAASSPRHRPRTVVSAPLLNPHPILTSILTPCRRPSSSVLTSICSPRSAIFIVPARCRRIVAAPPPLLVATTPTRRRRRPRVVPSRACIVPAVYPHLHPHLHPHLRSHPILPSPPRRRRRRFVDESPSSCRVIAPSSPPRFPRRRRPAA